MHRRRRRKESVVDAKMRLREPDPFMDGPTIFQQKHISEKRRGDRIPKGSLLQRSLQVNRVSNCLFRTVVEVVSEARSNLRFKLDSDVQFLVCHDQKIPALLGSIISRKFKALILKNGIPGNAARNEHLFN